MTANERRMEIIEVLNRRRHETMKNLAFEFDVTTRTIRNDINELSLSYPIITKRGRYDGGVMLMDGFKLNRKYLKADQQELLERISTNLTGKDLEIAQSILKEFALND